MWSRTRHSDHSKQTELTYRLVLPRTIISMGHCLLVHSFFTVDDSSRGNPCKLAFNGIRRNDPASSRYFSSGSLSSPFSSSDHGGEALCYRSFSHSRGTGELESRHDVNSWLPRGGRSISVPRDAEARGGTGEKNRSVDRRNERTKRASETI